ncbi:MAG: hypothetical protein J6R66_06220 [Clostridia bacterium]|nr:hypothetical protein [Clostridia bacterium]
MKDKKILMTFLLFFAIISLISKTETVTTACQNALKLCAVSVIPALFPFFVMTGLMVNTGVVAFLGKLLAPISKVLFKTSGTGAVVFIIGILCGYPTGAKVISDLYLNGKLTKEESERLLAFCNNSGPLFVIGAVGAGMLGNKQSGMLLYCIHALSAVITGVFLSFFAKKKELKVPIDMNVVSLGEAFTQSVESAVKSILNVCGYVVFFACFLSVVSPYIPGVFIKSLFEVTVGAKYIISSGFSKEHILTLLSGTIGFGGFCVYFQVRGAVAKACLSTRCYLFGKTLQMTVSMIIMKIYLFINSDVEAFAPVATVRTAFHISYVMLFAFLLCLVFTLRRLTKKI